jgi:hypothetical protein
VPRAWVQNTILTQPSLRLPSSHQFVAVTRWTSTLLPQAALATVMLMILENTSKALQQQRSSPLNASLPSPRPQAPRRRARHQIAVVVTTGPPPPAGPCFMAPAPALWDAGGTHPAGGVLHFKQLPLILRMATCHAPPQYRHTRSCSALGARETHLHLDTIGRGQWPIRRILTN